MQRSALCRSQRELSNAYLLSKFGFDTAENEPSKVRWGAPCSIAVLLPSSGRLWDSTDFRSLGGTRYVQVRTAWTHGWCPLFWTGYPPTVKIARFFKIISPPPRHYPPTFENSQKCSATCYLVHKFSKFDISWKPDKCSSNLIRKSTNLG